MKKNKMMRLASAMMVTTLMTTSVISGTFAKYVTSDDASDSARVAKWGITVMASGELFGTDYSEFVSSTEGNTIVAAGSDSVSSDNGMDIVAPGTKNKEGFSINITGEPEVAYTITADTNGQTVEDIFLGQGKYGVMVKATGLNADSNVVGYYTSTDEVTYNVVGAGEVWSESLVYYELHDYADVGADYYPINWTVVNGGSLPAIADTKNLTTINAAIVNKINGLGEKEANTNAYAKYVLTWEWPFESGNDEADTILGNLMVNGGVLIDGSKVVTLNDTLTKATLPDSDDYNLHVAFGLKVTVTQVD